VTADPGRRDGILRWLRGSLTLGLVLLALWLVGNVLFVIFAGVLLGVLLRGLADWLSRGTGMPVGISLAIVLLAIVVLVAGTAYFLAPRASDQLNQLAVRLPMELHRLGSEIDQTSWGKPIVESFRNGGGAEGAVAGRVFGVATTAVDVVVALVVVLFVGLYTAADPGVYRRGALLLVPQRRRPRIAELLERIAEVLRWWLIGRIISMAIIAAMTTVGLWLLGVQLALTLGLLSGLLAFVPYVGSVTSAIPPILIALTESTALALYVVALYLGVHLVEGYVLVPLMQKRMVHLPPALTLSAQAILGALFGVIGLALATPLAAALVTATRMLYVEDVLENPARDRPTP
jgi:predicted PurR-regulated permease PerM